MNYRLLAAVALSACASSQPPEACPKCYSIDEVAPYEPPRRMIILCDQPDAAAPEPAPVEDEDAGECGARCVPLVEREYPPPKSDDPFARVF